MTAEAVPNRRFEAKEGFVIDSRDDDIQEVLGSRGVSEDAVRDYLKGIGKR